MIFDAKISGTGAVTDFSAVGLMTDDKLYISGTFRSGHPTARPVEFSFPDDILEKYFIINFELGSIGRVEGSENERFTSRLTIFPGQRVAKSSENANAIWYNGDLIGFHMVAILVKKEIQEG